MACALLELENKLIEIINPDLTDKEYLENLSKDYPEIINNNRVDKFDFKHYSNPIQLIIRADNIVIGNKDSDIDISVISRLDKFIFDTSNMLLFTDTSMSVFKNYSRVTNKYIKYQVGDVFHFSTYLCLKIRENHSYAVSVFDSDVVKVNILSIGALKDSHTSNKQIVINEKKMCKTVIDLEVPQTNFTPVKLAELVKRLVPTIVSITLTLILLRYQSRGLYIYIGIITTIISLIITIIDFISKKITYRKQIRDSNIVFDNYVKFKKLAIIGAYKLEQDQLNYLYPKLEKLIENIDKENYIEKTNINEIKVRIGSGLKRSSYQINCKVNEQRPNLSIEEICLLQLKQTYSYIEDAPMVCNINCDTAIVGFTKLSYKLLTIILFQLVYFYSSKLFKVIVIIESNEIGMYYDFTHLNHFRLEDGIYTLVYDQTSLELVCESLKTSSANNYIIIQNCRSVEIGKLLLKQIDPSSILSTIYYTEDIGLLPKAVNTKIVVKDKSNCQIININGESECIKLDQYPSQLELKRSIQKLCKLDNGRDESRTGLPSQISFFELYGIESCNQLELEMRWKSNRPSNEVVAILGKSSKGNVLLDINERQDGPHGIIAGTTGSGKSELLKTFILSLAINYSPSYIGFVLIDYKGGAMANQFKGLPHILGSTSNLDESEANRIIISINSEIKSRQNAFKELNISHIDEYHELYEYNCSKQAIPRLIIICDEFAELKVSNPDFINSLISIARVGRSLGIHLILSTQKVGGLVDSQIIANSNFKIALKVADKIDSRELIESSKATEIKNKGAGYLVNANNLESYFQGGYVTCSANIKSSERLDLIDRYGRSKSLLHSKIVDSSQTQIETVIDYINLYMMGNKIPTAKPIWQEPLESNIEMPIVNSAEFKAQIGVVDIPTKQSQELFEIDLINCNVIAVVGAGTSGKTNTLKTILLSLALNTNSEDLKYYILDKGNEVLSKLDSLHHCAEYINLFDNESIKLLCNHISHEIDNRSKLDKVSSNERQRIVIVLDDFDAVNSDNIEIMKLINIILNRGTNVGIFLILACTKYGSIKLEYQPKISLIIHHYTPDKYDLVNAFGTRMETVFKKVAGRAVINSGGLNQVQVYNCTSVQDTLIDEVNSKYSHANAKLVRMPKQVTYKDYYHKANKLFIGLDEETIKPCYIEFKPLLVYGTNYKTSFISLLLNQVEHNIIILEDESNSFKEYGIKGEYYHANQFEEFVSRLRELRTTSVSNKSVIYINQCHGFNGGSQKLQEQCIAILLTLLKLNVMIIFEMTNCFESNKLTSVAKEIKYKIYFGDPHNQNIVRFPLNAKPRNKDNAFLINEKISEVKVMSIEKSSIF